MKSKLFENSRSYQESLQGFRDDFQALEQLVDDLFEQLHVLRVAFASKENELECVQHQLDHRTCELEKQRSEASSLAAYFEHHDAQLANALELLEEFKAEPLAPPIAAEAIARDAETERLIASEQQRAALEAELEHVRSRAAELQETIFEQKQDIAARFGQQQQDLRYVRSLLEQKVVAVQQANAAPAPEQTTSDCTPEVSRIASDPVTESVKAQFSKLQQNVVKRRTKRN